MNPLTPPSGYASADTQCYEFADVFSTWVQADCLRTISANRLLLLFFYIVHTVLTPSQFNLALTEVRHAAITRTTIFIRKAKEFTTFPITFDMSANNYVNLIAEY